MHTGNEETTQRVPASYALLWNLQPTSQVMCRKVHILGQSVHIYAGISENHAKMYYIRQNSMILWDNNFSS